MLVPIRQDVGGDPHFGNVGLLLPLRNHLRDESKALKAVTVGGNAAIVGDSAYFDGAGDYLRVAHNASTEIGAGDFTVELDLSISSYGVDGGAGKHIVGTYTYGSVENGTSNDGWQFNYAYNGTFAFGYGLGGSWTSVLSGASSAPLNTWMYLALTRAGNTVRLFKDGKIVATATHATNFSRSKDYVTVGSYNRNDAYAFADFLSVNGRIKNLRITAGIARYVSNFTPPKSIPIHGVARAYDA